MPMTNPFEWYDKHFNEIEIVNPTRRTRMKARRIKTGGILITTSDPLMLKQWKKEKDRVTVIAVELDPDSIGLRTVRSLTVKVYAPEPCL